MIIGSILYTDSLRETSINVYQNQDIGFAFKKIDRANSIRQRTEAIEGFYAMFSNSLSVG